MPRFFFDIHDGCRQTLDEEGTELADLPAACAEAVAVPPALAETDVGTGGAREIVATVRGENGIALFRARLSLATEMVGRAEEQPAPSLPA